MYTLFRRYCFPLWLRLQIVRGLLGRPWLFFVWLFQQLLKIPWEILLALDVLGALWLMQFYQLELMAWQPPHLPPADPQPLAPHVVPEASLHFGSFMASMLRCFTIGAAIGWAVLFMPYLRKHPRVFKWLAGLIVVLLVFGLYAPSVWGAIRSTFYLIGIAGWLIWLFQLGSKVRVPGSRPHAE